MTLLHKAMGSSEHICDQHLTARFNITMSYTCAGVFFLINVSEFTVNVFNIRCALRIEVDWFFVYYHSIAFIMERFA